MTRRNDASSTLDTALDHLEQAVEIAHDIMGEDQLGFAREVLERAGQRRSLAPERTVIALLGATGSGKSSLFNTMTGTNLARATVLRPTTTQPLAAVASIDAGDAGPLLDWLGVSERAPLPVTSGLGEQSIILDLPDIDSTDEANRAIASRMATIVDVLIWVLDPQKYADAVVHKDYLTPMARHVGVTIVVLNQADRLTEAETTQVLDDCRRILHDDGLADVPLMAVSARTGAGVDELRAHIAQVAEGKRAAQARLLADVRTAAHSLAVICGIEAPQGKAGVSILRGMNRWHLTGSAKVASHRTDAAIRVDNAHRSRLITAACAASGIDAVTDAVRSSYRRRASHRVGWLPIRWVGRLRRDPLRRLHLDKIPSVIAGPDGTDLVIAARTSLPQASAVHTGALRTAVHALVTTTGAQLPPEWAAMLTARAHDSSDELIDIMDEAIARTDLEQDHTPAWWLLANVIQWIVFFVALVGGIWLGALAVLGYLHLPEPTPPKLGELPWPTLLLLGGVLLGIACAVLGRGIATLASSQRARRCHDRLTESVTAVVDSAVVVPLEQELERYGHLRAALWSVMATS